jgi:hypothetical protein
MRPALLVDTMYANPKCGRGAKKLPSRTLRVGVNQARDRYSFGHRRGIIAVRP